MSEILALFAQMRWQDVADILLVAFVVYHVILLIRGTRAMQMLAGLGVVLMVLVVSRHLNMETTNWILNSFFASFILIIVVLFQSDIRRALSRMGQGPLFGAGSDPSEILEEVVRTAVSLASRMTGGLVVLERKMGLANYIETGTKVDAKVSRELMVSLFQPPGPLHDGAVVIRGERIVAARCLLPLSGNPNLGRHLGTRHRAALGLSEESDAVCVVVSEERGRVSVAVGGRLTPDLDAAALRNMLYELFEVGRERHRRFLPWRA
jgi:diadenylate cyclase